jgi:hypothetical protein
MSTNYEVQQKELSSLREGSQGQRKQETEGIKGTEIRERKMKRNERNGESDKEIRGKTK